MLRSLFTTNPQEALEKARADMAAAASEIERLQTSLRAAEDADHDEPSDASWRKLDAAKRELHRATVRHRKAAERAEKAQADVQAAHEQEQRQRFDATVSDAASLRQRQAELAAELAPMMDRLAAIYAERADLHEQHDRLIEQAGKLAEQIGVDAPAVKTEGETRFNMAACAAMTVERPADAWMAVHRSMDVNRDTLYRAHQEGFQLDRVA